MPRNAAGLLMHPQEQQDRGLADGRVGGAQEVRYLGRDLVAPVPYQPGKAGDQAGA